MNRTWTVLQQRAETATQEAQAAMQTARNKVTQLDASLAHIEKLKVDYLERYSIAQKEAHSISAGLDYPGVGPEHAWLKDLGRTEYFGISDDEAMTALKQLSQTEGIIPAIETAHALAGALKLAAEMSPEDTILVNLSGRGDKDMETAAKYFGLIGTTK